MIFDVARSGGGWDQNRAVCLPTLSPHVRRCRPDGPSNWPTSQAAHLAQSDESPGAGNDVHPQAEHGATAWIYFRTRHFSFVGRLSDEPTLICRGRRVKSCSVFT